MRSKFWLKIICACCIIMLLCSSLKAQELSRVQILSAMRLMDIYEPHTGDSVINFQGKKYLVLLKQYFQQSKLKKVSVYQGMDYVDWTEPHILNAELFHKAYDLSDSLQVVYKNKNRLRLNQHTYALKAKEEDRWYLLRLGKKDMLYVLVYEKP